MITMRVKLLGFLAQMAQQTELEFNIEAGSTVSDLIRLIVERHGLEFRRSLLDGRGNVQGGLELVLNHKQISARCISEISLWEDGSLVIMPLVGGG